jgi:carbohydrate-binding DOMON domain-containing protein
VTPRLALPLAALLLSAAPAAGGASPRLVASFDDPAGDAYGPGSYLPPGDSEFADGDFDLRKLAVRVDGEDVVLEITLGASIRLPASTQRTNETPIDLANGIYLQNVDVYVDTDPTSTAGQSTGIPGRRVAFAGGRTWKAAVVLTPQPGAVRDLLDDTMGPAAARVLVARNIQARGRTLVARVPVSFLGGSPRDDWGWSVQVSGARWERTYARNKVRGLEEVDAFTMPVLPIRQAWAFGGATRDDVHPRVVDVLLPPGVDQRKVLGSYDAAAGTFARVPFVQVRPTPAAVAEAAPSATAAPAAPALAVVDVSGDVVTLSGTTQGLVPLQIGRVLDPDGNAVGRVVVVRVLGDGVVASVAEGRERIVRGAKVVFDAPAVAGAAGR